MRRINELKALQREVHKKKSEAASFRDGRANKNQPLSFKEKKLAKSLVQKKPDQPPGGIVKTVILPFDEINNIKAELEYLKQYRDQQKGLYEEAI